MATQVLVIFIIRTRKNPFRSRPNPWLIACSLTVVNRQGALEPRSPDIREDRCGLALVGPPDKMIIAVGTQEAMAEQGM